MRFYKLSEEEQIYKKAQIGTEYLLLLGFLIFVSTATLIASIAYSANMKEEIKSNQIEKFFTKVISSAESVFYSGEPSKLTIQVYLPSGVEEIQIYGREIIVNYTTESGLNIRAFGSKVNLSGAISASPGVKKIEIIAKENEAQIIE